jgi:hypothetical protein
MNVAGPIARRKEWGAAVLGLALVESVACRGVFAVGFGGAVTGLPSMTCVSVGLLPDFQLCEGLATGVGVPRAPPPRGPEERAGELPWGLRRREAEEWMR